MIETGLYFPVQREGRWEALDIAQMTENDIDQVKQIRPDWGKQVFDFLLNWVKQVPGVDEIDILILENLDDSKGDYNRVRMMVNWIQDNVERKHLG